MIQKRFDEIGKVEIESLVANAVEEGRTIEYKVALPGGKDAEKKEFLADVSSFANASGGDLIFGVDEQRGGDGKPNGVPSSAPGVVIPNIDAEIRRLENIIRDGVRPRIAGLHLKAIEGFPNGPVLLIRIQKSYVAPHMVTFQDHTRFFSRNSRGKYPLDVGEIRSAFALSESMPERIRQFRDGRLARIVAGETPVVLKPGPKSVLHVLPIAALDPANAIDLTVAEKNLSDIWPLTGGADGRRYNIDGYVTFDYRDKEGGRSYAQVFRSGAMEAVSGANFADRNGEKYIVSTNAEWDFITGLNRYLGFQRRLGLEPPFFVLLSLLGVKGYFMPRPRGTSPWADHGIERDELLLPDVIVQDAEINAESLLRPVLDALWQASGWRGSPNYDAHDKWAPGR